MIKWVWKILKFNRSLYGKVSQFISLVIVQSLSCVWLFVTPWTAARQASLSLTTSQSLPKFMSVASVMPSSYFILWCPLLLLPSIFPSIRDFSNEYSGLISLKSDWFDILAVQGTFRSFSPVPQLEGSINSLVFCLLYHPALTTVHDHWEDHSLDFTLIVCTF